MIHKTGTSMRSFFVSDENMPGPFLAFFAISVVVFLQIPVGFLMHFGFISASLIINELVVIAGVPILLILIFHFDRKKLISIAPTNTAILAFVVPLTLGAVIIIDFAITGSEHFFPLPKEFREMLDLLMKAETTGIFIWKIFLLCILPGVCEEIFFRGFCQTAFAARWGNKIAIILTAFVFAAFHMNPWYFHFYFLLGIIFGWLFAVTRSLWAPILCHALNNLWTFVNHNLDFKIPIKDALFSVNAAILLCGIAIFFISAMVIHRQTQARQ